METILARRVVLIRLTIGAVWFFHGLFSKILGGIPRHRLIVARVLGDDVAGAATLAVGFGEIGIAIWMISGRFPKTCALAQTLTLLSMNTLEIIYARDLLLSPVIMVILNIVLISSAWYVGLATSTTQSRAEPLP